MRGDPEKREKDETWRLNLRSNARYVETLATRPLETWENFLLLLACNSTPSNKVEVGIFSLN